VQLFYDALKMGAGIAAIEYDLVASTGAWNGLAQRTFVSVLFRGLLWLVFGLPG
jgi:hypothetical protein